MGFRLAPTSVTLNDLEQRYNPYIALLHRLFHSFGSWLQHICRISSSTFGQNWPTLQRGLSAIAELLVCIVVDST